MDCFSTAAYTSLMLHGLMVVKKVNIKEAPRLGSRQRLYCEIGWPKNLQERSKVEAYALECYKMSKAFLEANFPDWEWREKFQCFNQGKGRLPRAQRLAYIRDLAIKEKHDPERSVAQFDKLLPVMERLYTALAYKLVNQFPHRFDVLFHISSGCFSYACSNYNIF